MAQSFQSTNCFSQRLRYAKFSRKGRKGNTKFFTNNQSTEQIVQAAKSLQSVACSFQNPKLKTMSYQQTLSTQLPSLTITQMPNMRRMMLTMPSI